MPTSRGSEGVDELRDAAALVGLTASVPQSDDRVDLFLVNPAGGVFEVQVNRMSLASAEAIVRKIGEWERRSANRVGLRVVVADRVTHQAREFLKDAGWGWLDLRGHLHLVGEGLFIDTDVPTFSAISDHAAPLAGRAGQEVAALLLLEPDRPASVREIARIIGRSVSTISQALRRMREASLVDEHRRPVIPDLFWALADRWNPKLTYLERPPSPAVKGLEDPVNEALRLGLEDVEATTGWALTDTMAAAAYGAPVATRSDHPPDFYVPDQSTFRRATQLLGSASHHRRAATIKVAPINLVCAHRVDWHNETWPLAKPLFVALDLSRDSGRGREILANWTPPPEAGNRVW